MLRILRIIVALTVIVMSAIGLYTGQNNFFTSFTISIRGFNVSHRI